MTKHNAIICDLDGTLCNIEHRLHNVRNGKKDWKAFFEGIPGDSVNTYVLTALEAFMHGLHYDIVFCSGRPSNYFDTTQQWLYKNTGIPYNALVMRPEGDHRPDYIVKKELYHKHIEPYWNVKLVLDDRKSVVDMWRKLGLECWQAAEGNF